MNIAVQVPFRSSRSALAWKPEWAVHGTASSASDASANPRDQLLVPAKPLGTATPAEALLRPKPAVLRVDAAAGQLERRLFDALAAMKIKTAEVAMHLNAEWRGRLFDYLDFLHDAEDWDEGDEPAKLSSFTTFLRMVMHLRSPRRPGMGLTSTGHLVATWTTGKRHLTIECLPDDEVIWSVSVPAEDGVETAAGRCGLTRLPLVFAPYEPEQWFANER